ncbi:DUF4062 domain-containing protein [Acetobacterium sp.]|uniref:DUF4062 domain-containing protein n=1 Tax=Acetobacterium sp. TaxID=1872094 RepID=UPI002F3ECD34
MVKKKLQVFISSTYIDLIDERQSAVQAVLDSGHIPAGMELFKAGNETQLDTIYKWIDNSDVYMLILGGRYGSVEEKSQKSYTRLEYEYAINKGIPVFSVVLDENFLKEKACLLGEDRIYEQKNIDGYSNFKDFVLSKIVRMVNDSKDIMLAVHSTLVDFLEDYDLIGWVRANDSEANTLLLTQINELSIENKQLHEKNSKLLDEINLIQSTFDSSLAFEGESTTIEGTYTENIGNNVQKQYRDRSIEQDITWDKMFLLWAPYLTATINSIRAKGQLESALRDFVGRRFRIKDNLFQKIKIQYSALGLLKYYEAPTTQGSTAEFITLTPKGTKYLIKNTAVKNN